MSLHTGHTIGKPLLFFSYLQSTAFPRNRFGIILKLHCRWTFTNKLIVAVSSLHQHNTIFNIVFTV